MKTLLILRHAKSSWKEVGVADHDRPLNKRGYRDAPRVGRLIRRESLVPEIILCSTALRAQTTAQLVAEACGYAGEILFLQDLYHASPSQHIATLRQRSKTTTRVMIVAHNPGVEELLTALTGSFHRLPTAALAQLTLPVVDWSQLSQHCQGTLEGLWRPRELPEDL